MAGPNLTEFRCLIDQLAWGLYHAQAPTQVVRNANLQLIARARAALAEPKGVHDANMELVARARAMGRELTIHRGNLEWENHQEMPTEMSWDKAHGYVNRLNARAYAGHADWRLPTVQELVSLVDYTRHDPAIDPAFEHTVSNYYWSSSTCADGPNYAWYVSFNFGGVYAGGKSSSYYVRAVRAGSGTVDYTDGGNVKPKRAKSVNVVPCEVGIPGL